MADEVIKNEEIEKDLAAAKAQAEEYLAGWKRAKADLINFQKEQEKKQKDIIEFASASFILEILPIYESLKQALLHTDKGSEDLATGIRQIKKQFDDLLKRLGIEEIKTIGEKFNPDFHEAVGKRKEEDKEEGIILEEVKTGFLINGKVLEPAKVIVNSF